MRLTLGAVEVDLDTREVRRGDEVQGLTPSEVALLKYLVEHAPFAVSRMDLQVHVLGYAEQSRTRAVDNALARLRQKVEEDPAAPRFLVGVRGFGYRLKVPAASADAAPSSGLIGRDECVAELVDLPPGVHVLVGPGGVGKTSVARAVCARRGGQFASLSHARSEAAAIDGVGRALDISLRGSLEQQHQQIRSHLEHHDVQMLVLDNLEQLQNAVIESLCGSFAAHDRVLLLTSRRRLNVSTSLHHDIRPLGVDDAMTLYERRAAERIDGFRLTDPSRVELSSFLHAVDHLPLAIELAASRVDVLSPADLAARGERMLTLRGESTDHTTDTLAQCIRMSWDLLDSDAQLGWMAAAVFEGGFGLAGFEAVSNVDSPLDTLQTLLDHGLIGIDLDHDGPRRFTWMVALRSFVISRLQNHPDSSELRDRHLAFYAAESVRRDRDIEASGDASWPIRERDNLLAAASWGLETQQSSVYDVLRILEVVFHDRGPAADRVALFRRAWERMADAASLPQQVFILSRLALALIGVGRRTEALEHGERVKAMLPELEDGARRARAWMAFGAMMLHTGQLEAAAEAMEACTEEGLRAGNVYLTGLGRYNHAFALHGLGRSAEAMRLAQLALAELRSANAPYLATAALTLVATLHQQAGDLDQAHRALQQETGDGAGRHGLIWMDSQATLAGVLVALERTDEALALLETLIDRARHLAMPDWEADLRTRLAEVLLAAGRPEEAIHEADRAAAQHQRLDRVGHAEQALAVSRRARQPAQDRED